MLRLCLLLSLFSVAVSAQETAVIIHKWDNSVGFYDAATGRALAKVAVNERPHEMAVSADGRFAYVTNYGVNSYTQQEQGGHTISVIDLGRRAKVGDIDLGRFRRPHGIEMGRSGRLYVTCDFPAALLVVDPVKRSVVGEIQISSQSDRALPHMVAVTRDERRAYTANAGAGTVSVISLGDGKVIKNIEIGGVPMGFALSRDERVLYATNRTGNAVAVIDTGRGEVAAKITIPGQPARCALTPDGKHLLVSLIESGELAVVDTASRREVRRLPVGKAAEGIGLDEAGEFGYASAQGEDKVVKFSLKDWRAALEIKTAARPDPIHILKAPRRATVQYRER
jgi:YVTN family beta-propeller protein